MAITAQISQKELARVADLAYEGETITVMLCSVGASGYTVESTVANWQSVEKSGNGYVRFTAVASTGSYDATDGRHEVPLIDAAFTATGAGYSFDRVAIYVAGATYLHSLLTESPAQTLLAGQTKTYRILLATDD